MHYSIYFVSSCAFSANLNCKYGFGIFSCSAYFDLMICLIPVFSLCRYLLHTIVSLNSSSLLASTFSLVYSVDLFGLVQQVIFCYSLILATSLLIPLLVPTF